ncbi:hypothetical protein EVAR_19602_1 [Eumeta japonica]|uniref:Uncharacterized protein n=1 Tax=Eumeta variegata TaxID=151549 RepID=A0A4C1UFA8_EUMVA|nr:hypothetical protein EVAR_19602_1 [Eumeta japonica]
MSCIDQKVVGPLACRITYLYHGDTLPNRVLYTIHTSETVAESILTTSPLPSTESGHHETRRRLHRIGAGAKERRVRR